MAFQGLGKRRPLTCPQDALPGLHSLKIVFTFSCLWLRVCVHFVVQSLSSVQLFATPWTAACQASCPSLLLDFAQTHIHCANNAIQPSHPLSPPSPLALSLSQPQGLFQRVCSSHQVAKVLELQLQHSGLSCLFQSAHPEQPLRVFNLRVLPPFTWTSPHSMPIMKHGSSPERQASSILMQSVGQPRGFHGRPTFARSYSFTPSSSEGYTLSLFSPVSKPPSHHRVSLASSPRSQLSWEMGRSDEVIHEARGPASVTHGIKCFLLLPGKETDSLI